MKTPAIPAKSSFTRGSVTLSGFPRPGLYSFTPFWGSFLAGIFSLGSLQAVEIDVKSYPAELQSAYQIVVAKCTTCHGLGETTKSARVLPSYWEKTVKNMQMQPKSGINDQDTQKITEFLTYYSNEARAAQLKKEMSSLPEGTQVEEKAKLDAILQKYTKG